MPLLTIFEKLAAQTQRIKKQIIACYSQRETLKQWDITFGIKCLFLLSTEAVMK